MNWLRSPIILLVPGTRIFKRVHTAELAPRSNSVFLSCDRIRTMYYHLVFFARAYFLRTKHILRTRVIYFSEMKKASDPAFAETIILPAGQF